MHELFFNYIAHWSYAGLFALLLIAGLGLPLPEDIPLLAAGWLVSEGHARFDGMVLTGLIGVLVGDLLMFHMGRRYGAQIVEHRWFRRILKPWLLEKARQKYEHHGAKIIFAARFMPGLRPVMFATAGMFRIKYWKFLIFDGSAALISVPLWVWIGREFPAYIKQILGGTRTATNIVVGLFVAVFVGFVLWEYLHNYRKRAGRMGAGEPGAARSAPLVKSGGEPRSLKPVDRPVVAGRAEESTTAVD